MLGASFVDFWSVAIHLFFSNRWVVIIYCRSVGYLVCVESL